MIIVSNQSLIRSPEEHWSETIKLIFSSLVSQLLIAKISPNTKKLQTEIIHRLCLYKTFSEGCRQIITSQDFQKIQNSIKILCLGIFCSIMIFKNAIDIAKIWTNKHEIKRVIKLNITDNPMTKVYITEMGDKSARILAIATLQMDYPRRTHITKPYSQ